MIKTIFLTIAGTVLSILILFGLVYLVSPPDRRKVLWAGYLRVTHKIGVFNSKVILSIFYWLVIAPYAIFMTPFMDPMRVRGRHTWIKRATRDLSRSDAEKQF